MILVFGGTTEGRKAVEVLEEAGSNYFYSTKTGEQELSLHNGQRIDGAMNGEAMRQFCQEHQIRLIVDAAHPFATQLHETIAEVADTLAIPVVRYERIYPPRDPDITWIDDYSQVPTDIHSLLATTGVQSISKLKWLEAQGVKVFYRILPRKSSIALAHQQGATNEQLCFYELNIEQNYVDRPHDLRCATITGVSPHDSVEAILLKESGLSGGFIEKVEAAREKGMRIIALKHPDLFTYNSSLFTSINGPYGLRRAVEKLLPEFFPLHSGLTTGTCATAAAVADAMRLLKGETPAEVPVVLPDGETIFVPVIYGHDYAACIKEAGDDPDVTNGIEVRASVEEGEFEILGGEGVGTITLPGFDYPPGSPAINKGPREMIRKNVMEIVKRVNHGDRPHDLRYATITGVSPHDSNPHDSSPHDSLRVTISVPNGAEIARRTFNPRLGIEGGISIIGVSGIVKPFSEEAFIDSIRKCMEVAKAAYTNSHQQRVVINSGGKSERFVKALYPELPKQAFVEYGNYIGETLKIAHELGIPYVTLGVMLGKAVKLAAGHLDTHSRKATMDKAFISEMLKEADCDIVISDITLARELWDRLPADKKSAFARIVINHCAEHCCPLLPNGQLTILLIDDEGHIYPK